MKVPIIVFKTDKGFSPTIVGLNYFYLCHETYDELESDFMNGISSAIEEFHEEGEPIPTAEEIKNALIEDISIQDLEDFYKIKFIDYNV